MEFKCLDVPLNNSKEMQNMIDLYRRLTPHQVNNNVLISQCSQEHYMCPLVSFDNLLRTKGEVKVEGFIVKIKMRNKEIVITLWDGACEDNLIYITVTQDKVSEFLNGKKMDELKEKVIGYNKLFQGVIKKDYDTFKLIGTWLINN